MTVICGEVGGSFGMKSGIHPEVPLLAWASRRVGRPVKWVCERSEAFFSDDQARDMVFEAELGLDAEGRFLGARLSANNNMGAFVGMRGFVTPPGIAQSVPGVYATPAVHGQCAAVLSNTVPVSNYRGPGRAAANYVLERIINMAAGDLGLDAAEIRRRNFIQPEAMPYALSVGGIYDCGEFERVMDKCLELGDYPGAAKRKEDAARRDRLLGVGLSMSIDPTSPPSPETAELRFDPGGGATILVGSTTSGQSHETLYVQILSGMLGLEVENIRVIEGDTDRLSWGAGTGAARTATIGGSAVFKAAEKVIEKGRRIAAYLLEAAIGDIEFRDASYSVSGTDRAVSFAAVAEAAFAPAKLPPGEEPGLFETATWSPEVYNFPNACHLCELEIDPETGRVAITRYAAVHDVGVEVNPLLVRGQVHGGIAQGAGQALMENIHYDGQSGQLLSGSLMDYALPRADDFTDFDVASHPVPTETNPLGVKGAGECGTIGALAAVMNALNDALAPLGVRNLAMPATPERVWRAIRDASPTDRQQISVP
jgi:carbon-monoxide dehydrogenase large subunit